MAPPRRPKRTREESADNKTTPFRSFKRYKQESETPEIGGASAPDGPSGEDQARQTTEPIQDQSHSRSPTPPQPIVQQDPEDGQSPSPTIRQHALQDLSETQQSASPSANQAVVRQDEEIHRSSSPSAGQAITQQEGKQVARPLDSRVQRFQQLLQAPEDEKPQCSVLVYPVLFRYHEELYEKFKTYKSDPPVLIAPTHQVTIEDRLIFNADDLRDLLLDEIGYEVANRVFSFERDFFVSSYSRSTGPVVVGEGVFRNKTVANILDTCFRYNKEYRAYVVYLAVDQAA